MVNLRCQKPGNHRGRCLQLLPHRTQPRLCLVTWANSSASCLLKVSCQKVVCKAGEARIFLNVKKCSAGLGCHRLGGRRSVWGWFEVGTGAALAAEGGAGDIEEGEARAAGSQVCVSHLGEL